MSLRLDFSSYEAAKFACEHWHYSGCVPAGKMVRIGVWEDDKFVGVVLFSRGANYRIGSPYGLLQTEVCELTRVALRGHQVPVSRILAIAMRLLRKHSPGLRLIVSYADPEQDHHGGIYQAGNWIYTGRSQAGCNVIYAGKVMHKRSAHSLFGTIKGLEKAPIAWKHKYLMPLDPALRPKLETLRKDYPKRAKMDAMSTPHQSADESDPPAPTLCQAADQSRLR
jgi:hypothetical protein